MSESSQRRTVIRALKPLWAIPVENPIQPGTPDVNYIEGWIELKWLRRWPKNEETIVRLPHFTVQQRRWLRRRWERGGAAWLLLQCKRDWLLFTGPDAARYVGEVTRENLHQSAHASWTLGLNQTELIQCLQQGAENLPR